MPSPLALLADLGRGAAMGASIDVLGSPVDLLATLLRPLGYKSERPVMGSEWLAEKLGVKQSGSIPEQAARFATGILAPGPDAMSALGLLGAIKAYHGSPHKFDKFSMDRIGTGEGAQAYGHGLYFAENPGVAKEYAKIDPSKAPPPNRLFRGQELTPGSPEYHAGTLLEQMSLPQARKEVARWIQDGTPDTRALDGWKRTLEILNLATKKGDFKVGSNDNLYEISLRWPDAAREAADPLGPQHFLDWDKPLSQQPEGVRKVLDYAPEKWGAIKQYAEDEFKSKGIPFRWGDLSNSQKSTFARKYKARFGDDPSPAFYENQNPSGEHFYKSLLENYGSQVDASDYLRSLGIPGIRYLDGGSRAAGEGTANYVAFDDAIVEILKRNGINIR